MKKVLAICLTLIMLVSISVPAFAEFVSSPSGVRAPELIEGKNESEDCDAMLVITAYADKHDLPEETRKKLEEAYDIIKKTGDLSKLTEDVKDVADEAGVDVGNLAVSDMFDISSTDCGTHADHGHFDITLKPESLKNFVCLLHYYNGEWRVVKDAKITQNGQHLEFTEDEFSPFAIVVATEESPKTGLDNSLWIYLIIMVVSAAALFFIWKKTRKQRA